MANHLSNGWPSKTQLRHTEVLAGQPYIKFARLQTRYIICTLVNWLKQLHHTHAVTYIS